MSRAKLKLYSLPLILLATWQLVGAQTSKGDTKPSNRLPAAIYVETSIKSWTDGYVKWVASRHDVVLALQKSSGGVQITLHTPFLDYFASDGKSLYSNSSASANIDFLRKLPQSERNRPGNEDVELEPTVGDYLDMFPKLSPYKAQILARKRPVLLAICKDDTPTCVDQNQALKQLKGRAASLGIQVIEVKLSKNPQGE
jgi:hypothetical protein